MISAPRQDWGLGTGPWGAAASVCHSVLSRCFLCVLRSRQGTVAEAAHCALALGLSEPTGNREATQEPQTEGAQGPLDSGNAIDLALPGRGGREQGWPFQLSERMPGFWVDNVLVLILNPLQLQQTQPASHTPTPRRRLQSKVSPSTPLAS